MHLFFWQNIISPHQAPFMRELARAGHEVVVISTEAMSEDRGKLGWAVPSLGPAKIILGPAPLEVEEIVEQSNLDSIHLIAGARGTPLGRQTAIACRASKRRMGIITEAPDMRMPRGFLRWMKYSWEQIRSGNSFDFILAMGEKGVRWFKRFGYSEQRVFLFTYVTEQLAESHFDEIQSSFRFLFVGQLISRKGVDLLLRALVLSPGSKLSIVGDGHAKRSLRTLAQRCRITDRVAWLGQMDGAQVHARIAGADALVLPSREDGWGAVVNESLTAGTPVICSTACGAADLIRQPWLGSVFQSGSASALASALSVWAGKGKRTVAERERIRSWASCIEAPSIARYVERILDHVYNTGSRPQAPWRCGSA